MLLCYHLMVVPLCLACAFLLFRQLFEAMPLLRCCVTPWLGCVFGSHVASLVATAVCCLCRPYPGVTMASTAVTVQTAANEPLVAGATASATPGVKPDSSLPVNTLVVAGAVTGGVIVLALFIACIVGIVKCRNREDVPPWLESRTDFPELPASESAI